MNGVGFEMSGRTSVPKWPQVTLPAQPRAIWQSMSCIKKSWDAIAVDVPILYHLGDDEQTDAYLS